LGCRGNRKIPAPVHTQIPVVQHTASCFTKWPLAELKHVLYRNVTLKVKFSPNQFVNIKLLHTIKMIIYCLQGGTQKIWECSHNEATDNSTTFSS
jgi:hypothetical protein